MDGIAQLSPREEQDRRIAALLLRQLGEFVRYVGAAGVTDLMLNPDGSVWVRRAGRDKEMVGRMAASAAEAFIGAVASTVHAEITRERPILECELPKAPPFRGARIEAMIPPIVARPAFAIRFHAAAVYRLAEYVERGIMSAAQHALLRDAAARRLNVVIAGGTSSGKTTLLNSYLAEMAEVAPDHRVVIIQDTNELQCAAADVVELRATDAADQQRLLKVAMRLTPDRIVVGEVRGGEALALLKAWNTGHDGGASTLHATSASQVPLRLEQLIQEVSQAPQREHIAAALHLIVFIAKEPGSPGRRVREVLSIAGLDGEGRYVFKAEG